MKSLITILTFVAIALQSVNAQKEKRLALVIGNANYDEGALKNPVNDALLMAKTLKELNFDVILDTNIANRRAFINKITEFGVKRPNYDVGFVFYAGHGVQVGGENFLLPTKEEFKSENDIRDYALSVQNIMRHLTAKSDQVNVLILDACRNNPFESNWNSTRSIAGSGLAKMQAPSGSLIAFSTTAGNTAPDGDGKNSIYCQSLAKNMLLEGVNLDQVFRNVRAEVLELTNKKQMTEESTQLTGKTFYLVENNFTEELATIDSLYAKEMYTEALESISELITRKEEIYNSAQPSDYYMKSRIYWKLGAKERKEDIIQQNYNKAIENITTSIELDSSNSLHHCFRGFLYTKIKDFDNAELDFDNAIKINPNIPDNYHEKGRLLLILKDTSAAKEIFNKCFDIDSLNIRHYYHRESIFEPHEAYFFRSNIYEEFNEGNKAIQFYDNQLSINPKSASLHYERSGLYFVTGQIKKAISDLSIALKHNQENSDFYHFRSLLHAHIGDFKNAEKDALTVIDKSPSDPSGDYLLGYIHEKNEEYLQAIMRYSEAISKKIFQQDLYYIPTLNDDNFTLCDLYKKRAELFEKLGHKTLMCDNIRKATEQKNCIVEVDIKCK